MRFVYMCMYIYNFLNVNNITKLSLYLFLYSSYSLSYQTAAYSRYNRILSIIITRTHACAFIILSFTRGYISHLIPYIFFDLIIWYDIALYSKLRIFNKLSESSCNVIMLFVILPPWFVNAAHSIAIYKHSLV